MNNITNELTLPMALSIKINEYRTLTVRKFKALTYHHVIVANEP